MLILISLDEVMSTSNLGLFFQNVAISAGLVVTLLTPNTPVAKTVDGGALDIEVDPLPVTNL